MVNFIMLFTISGCKKKSKIATKTSNSSDNCTIMIGNSQNDIATKNFYSKR